MVLSLEEVKLYLKVDGDEDNTLITNLIGAAEELCQDILRFPLTEFTEVPETVKQALLYAIGNLYELREAVDMKALIEFRPGSYSPTAEKGGNYEEARFNGSDATAYCLAGQDHHQIRRHPPRKLDYSSHSVGSSVGHIG